MCSCGNNDVYPLEGKCLTKSVVYNAEVVIKGRKKMNIYERKKLKTLEEEIKRKMKSSSLMRENSTLD